MIEVTTINDWQTLGSSACAVYEAWGGEDERSGHIPWPPLLYVGITNSPERRLEAHRRQSEWIPGCRSISVTWYRSREEAAATEMRLIRQWHPVFNTRGGICRCGNTCPTCFYLWVYPHTREQVAKLGRHTCPSGLCSSPDRGSYFMYLGER